MCDGQLLYNGHREARQREKEREREANAGGKTKEKLKKGGCRTESRKVDKEGEVEINKMRIKNKEN